MKLLIYLLLLLTMPLTAQGKTDEKTLLDRIDKMIENDQYYQGIKEKELKHLKRQVYEAEDNQTRLLFLDSIYHAYSAYRYDSAYAYMKQGLELAEKCHNTYYILRNKINQASIYGHENEMYKEPMNLKRGKGVYMRELRECGGRTEDKTKCAKG